MISVFFVWKYTPDCIVCNKTIALEQSVIQALENKCITHACHASCTCIYTYWNWLRAQCIQPQTQLQQSPATLRNFAQPPWQSARTPTWSRRLAALTRKAALTRTWPWLLTRKAALQQRRIVGKRLRQHTNSADRVARLIQVPMIGGSRKFHGIMDMLSSGCASPARQHVLVGWNMRLKLSYLAH